MSDTGWYLIRNIFQLKYLFVEEAHFGWRDIFSANMFSLENNLVHSDVVFSNTSVYFHLTFTVDNKAPPYTPVHHPLPWEFSWIVNVFIEL